MSRLDLFIARMTSQRACLNFAAAQTAGMAGPVFELGLGNGRTYHHMREIMPDRDIYVFERAVASHPDSTPPDDRLILAQQGQKRRLRPRDFPAGGALAGKRRADGGQR